MNHAIVVFFLAAASSACGTIGGAVSGAGSDLNKAGEWIKKQ
jgi:predicted small secreted protein